MDRSYALYSLSSFALFGLADQLLMIGEQDALTGIYLLGQLAMPCREDWGAEQVGHPLFVRALAELEAYWAGRRRSFTLPYRLSGSPFQRAVWQALAELLYGTSISYQQLAQRVGAPRAYRAVAGAVGRNPLLFLLPCHRVIGQDGQLRGFAAGIGLKRKLLALEKGGASVVSPKKSPILADLSLPCPA